MHFLGEGGLPNALVGLRKPSKFRRDRVGEPISVSPHDAAEGRSEVSELCGDASRESIVFETHVT